MPANNEAVLTIQQGREKPVRNQHPWVFSGAIARMDGRPEPGDIVRVQDSKGRFLARGYFNPNSQIRARLLTWHEHEVINDDWWRDKLRRAIQARAVQQMEYGQGQMNAVRLVNAENDFLPGLVVDRYGNWLVLQALTLGIDVRKAMLVEHLVDLLHPQGIYERSDVDVRRKEGLDEASGVLWGEAPPDLVTIEETDLAFNVDIRAGHKTGFYLDQRENRGWLADLLTTTTPNEVLEEEEADARRVLNVFSYTGGFGVYALATSVGEVVNVDSSGPALALARQQAEINDLPDERVKYVQHDAFETVRDYAARGELFDVIVLDPPKLAQSAQQVERASRAYKDLNLHAFKCVRPGGYLFTFSCSGAVDQRLFQQIVFGALADSGRTAQIVRQLGAADDHPIALTFPEGAYLKGLLCRVW